MQVDEHFKKELEEARNCKHPNENTSYGFTVKSESHGFMRIGISKTCRCGATVLKVPFEEIMNDDSIRKLGYKVLPSYPHIPALWTGTTK